MKADPSGTIYKDFMVLGVRCLIMRGPGALCAYLGIPLNHTLAYKDYDDVDLDVHGGLTFAGSGEDGYRPKGYWWFGWDYAHSNDATFHDYHGAIFRGGHQWLVGEVEQHVIHAAIELHKY